VRVYQVWEEGTAETMEIEAHNPLRAAAEFVEESYGPVSGMGGQLAKYQIRVHGDGCPGLLFEVEAEWGASRIADALPTDPPVVIVVDGPGATAEEMEAAVSTLASGPDIPPADTAATTDDPSGPEVTTTDDGIDVRTSATTDAPEEG